MALERMVRFIVYDRLDQFKCEILPEEVMDVVSKEAVNGEHSLTITTTQELDKTDRIVVRDGMGLWHEFVVLGITASHDTAGVTVKEYYCPWSLQYDLSATYIDTNVGLVPGHASVPRSARDALTAALSGTDRWTIGTVGVTTMASASFYRMSGWEGIDTVLEVWGGEIAVTIGVGASGVTSRQVSLLPHVGTSTATRRFDYAGDLTSIQRIVSDEVWPCRIVPLGRSTETSAGGYTRRPTISSVNQGVPWIQDDEAVPYTRIPNGQGGWEYPTLVVKNDTYSDPAALKAWAIEHVSEYTRPQVCYKAEVAQFVKAGLNAHGVALGDNVVVVDREFDSAGLRIDARVLEIQQDLLDSTRMKLTIGNMEGSLAQQFGSLARSVTSITSHFENMGEYQSTATYLSELLASINEVANALGGYAYYTEGQGIRTYDRPVTDPLVGAEATKVVEIKGGTIRIADSRTSGGDWDWRTVFVAGHIAAELVTASNIVAGFIQSADGYSYWDLDANTLKLLGRNASVEVGNVDTSTGAMKSGTTITANELSYKSQYGVVFRVYSSNPSNYISDGILRVQSSDGTGFIQLKADHMTRHECEMWVANRFSAVSAENRYIFGGDGDTSTGKFSAHANYIELESVTCKVYGAFSVSGTKSRIVDTDDYGTRRLYAYETPSPMFGDLGSASTDESGECYVMLDDVFAQTARTDLPYQVFIQKCGEGDLWVAEKKPTHFVVRGTPNLAFDWELKAKQRDYESERLEDDFIATPDAPMDGMPSDMTYSNEMDEIVCGIADQYEQEITELEVMVR